MEEKGSEVSPIIKFLQFLREGYSGYHLYAHNAINFDNQFILEALIRAGQRVRFEGGVTKLVWVDPLIYFEDSYLLVGRGLRGLCEAFDVPRKLEWDHDSTTHTWDMGVRLDDFRRYLKRDCLSLSTALSAYSRRLLDLFGLTPASTLSLTSVKAFDKNFFPIRDIDSNTKYERQIRQATYGGRNEVYKRYGENLLLYDVRRMYTSCYDTPIPIGKLLWTSPDLEKGTIARAKVKVPTDLEIGPLPHRYRGRLIYPVGEFEGWWDTRLLSFVANHCNVDVSIVGQLQADEAPVLKEFGEYVQQISEGVSEAEARIWKLFGLRLAGKFGQNRHSTEIKHITEIGDLSGWYPIDREEIYHERPIVMKGKGSPYIKPAVSMRIRAEASRRHLIYMLLAGLDKIYYCDTDSVYTTETLPTGPYPGDLRIIDHAVRGYFVRPKLYGYVVQTSLKMKQRASGFHDFKLAEGDFQRLLRGESIENSFRSLGNWRSLLKGESVKLVDRQRVARLSEIENRVVDGLETRPLKLPEK